MPKRTYQEYIFGDQVVIPSSTMRGWLKKKKDYLHNSTDVTENLSQSALNSADSSSPNDMNVSFYSNAAIIDEQNVNF